MEDLVLDFYVEVRPEDSEPYKAWLTDAAYRKAVAVDDHLGSPLGCGCSHDAAVRDLFRRASWSLGLVGYRPVRGSEQDGRS